MDRYIHKKTGEKNTSIVTRHKWVLNHNMPLFSEDREKFEKMLRDIQKEYTITVGKMEKLKTEIKTLDEKYGHENIKVVKDVVYAVDVIISDSNKQE